jgi:hypothetical protein
VPLLLLQWLIPVPQSSAAAWDQVSLQLLVWQEAQNLQLLHLCAPAATAGGGAYQVLHGCVVRCAALLVVCWLMHSLAEVCCWGRLQAAWQVHCLRSVAAAAPAGNAKQTGCSSVQGTRWHGIPR